MPAIWIDIENSSGVRYGSGPITTATEWRVVETLDAMGAFQFSMPAADPQATNLAIKRRARCFLAPEDAAGWPGEVQELGYGIIDDISVRPQQNGPTMLDVRGSDILVELANTTVGDLDLYTEETRAPDEVRHIVTGGSNTLWTPGDSINLQPDPLSYIYVKDADAFISVAVTLGSSKNAQVATLKAQYFNEAATPMGWQEIDIVSDGTSSAGKPFAQNGTITFEVPSGWGKSTYGEYDLRIYCEDVNLDNVTFNTFSITVRNPTATALADIMGQAPAGWTLDPEGELATATTVYHQLSGQSILASLNWLAEQTGEHFVKSPAGRRVWWIGTAKQSSGLHAIQADPVAQRDDFALYIKDLQLVRKGSELFTRLYAKGSGNGADQITLNDSSDSAPIGYTLNKSSNYIERNAAVTEFGRIDSLQDFPEIAPADSSRDARRHAGNMLLQRALEELKRGSYEQRVYDLTVLPSKYKVFPGQTIWVSWHEWRDDYHAVNIEEELWVLATEAVVMPSGEAYTVGLTVGLVDAFPIDSATRTAQEIRTTYSARLQPIPKDGLISEGSGTPYEIGVKYGKVTIIKRHTPVASGTYSIAALDTITFADGIVTEVTEL